MFHNRQYQHKRYSIYINYDARITAFYLPTAKVIIFGNTYKGLSENLN